MKAAWVLVLVGAVGGCDLERIIGLSTDPTQTMLEDRAIHFSARNQVDLLLVVDDSGSMAPKQAQLRDALPALAGLVASGSSLDLHIGVVTTDLGAPGITCGANRGASLQRKGAASVGCNGPIGASWIAYSQEADNLPAGQSLVDTIACMTNVGDKGCGFEMPLEAAYRALQTPPPENIGFLRSDAILAILFLTDEDDCSIPPDSDLTSSNTAMYGNLASYRCTRFGITCDGSFPLPATPQSSFSACSPASTEQGNRLTDLGKYRTFFGSDAAHGGVKAEAADVILAAIRAPSTPFGTEPGTGEAECGQGVTSCTKLSHSCVSAADPTNFFGDPAVRIDSLVNGQGGLLRSICDSTYLPFAAELTTRIHTASAGAACIPGAVVNQVQPTCSITSGGIDVPPCGVELVAPLCWTVDFGTDCPPQLDPRNGALQRLHISFEGALRGDEQGTCQVLSATSA